MAASQKNLEIIAQTKDEEIVWDDAVCEDAEAKSQVLIALRNVKVMCLAYTLFDAMGQLWRVQVDPNTSIVKLSYSWTANKGVYYK